MADTDLTKPSTDLAKLTIEQLKARKADILAAREKRAEDREASEAKATLIRELEEQDAIDKAESDIGPGKFAVVPTDLGRVIVRRPVHSYYRKFQEKIGVDAASVKMDDFEALCYHALVYPDRARFAKLVEDLPATTLRVSGAISVLAGQRVEEIAKK